MNGPGLVVVVPSRSRPDAVNRVIMNWEATRGFGPAALHWVIDADDPTLPGYLDALVAAAEAGAWVTWTVIPEWQPLVPKLNTAAVELAAQPRWKAVGFAGDDHLPRTPGWAAAYLDALAGLGTGIVYSDDGYQGASLATQWAMTPDIVRELGAMVPAPVEHLYCDNAVMDLGLAAGCLLYSPDVLIEHMHPVVRKAKTDPQYQRVNSRAQYQRDRPSYLSWRKDQLPAQAAAVRALREA